MNKTVKEENLEDTSYLDNNITEDRTEREQRNVEEFLKVVKKRNLTLNDSKPIPHLTTPNSLGYCVGNDIKPDPERLKPLQEINPLKIWEDTVGSGGNVCVVRKMDP